MSRSNGAIRRLGEAVAALSLRRLVVLGIAALALAQIGVFALAGEPLRVGQKGRAFQVKAITIAIGETVLFDNNDEFIHQIYVESPDFTFDSAESTPGDTIELKFTKAGTFAIHCHIHPKMELLVTVK